MKAIYIIDMQNGFLNRETSFLINPIFELAKNAFDYADYVFFSAFINPKDSPFRHILNWNGFDTANEINFPEALLPVIKRTFYKTGYSGATPEFKAIIQSYGIKEVYLAGVDTDACVLKTAMDLFEMGVRPILLERYCYSSGGKDYHEMAIRMFERNIGKSQIERNWLHE